MIKVIYNKDGSVNVAANFEASEKAYKKRIARIKKLPAEERDYEMRAERSLANHINS